MFSPDLYLWALCLLFGGFCALLACWLTIRLGSAALTSGSENTMQVGQWIRLATSSPAVAFFALAILAGIGLPAYYSYLHRPYWSGDTGTVTVSGSFSSLAPKLCFQTDAVTSTSSGYVIKLPRQTEAVDFAIEPPNMRTTTSLMIEVNGSDAWYSVDNGQRKAVMIDSSGAVIIPDKIPIIGSNELHLEKQNYEGQQVLALPASLKSGTP